MTVLFSILLYPIFFIFSYVFAEYLFPTRNSAMTVSVFFALILSLLYYTIRDRFRQQSSGAKALKLKQKEIISAISLLDCKKFASFFGKDDFCDNSPSGINEDKTVEFLRRHDIKNIEIYSLFGINEGAKNILDFLGTEYKIHSVEEIIDRVDESTLKRINGNKRKKLRISEFFSPECAKFAIKYGVILALLSIFTPYKTYYLIFSGILILFAISIFISKKISQRNQTPYPRF